MKSRILWVIFDVLAVLVVLGRIGSAMASSHGILMGIVNLYPPFSGEQIGFDIASLLEDWLVIAVIIHNLQPRRWLPPPEKS